MCRRLGSADIFRFEIAARARATQTTKKRTPSGAMSGPHKSRNATDNLDTWHQKWLGIREFEHNPVGTLGLLGPSRGNMCCY